jgi:hypothetical protein
LKADNPQAEQAVEDIGQVVAAAEEQQGGAATTVEASAPAQAEQNTEIAREAFNLSEINVGDQLVLSPDKNDKDQVALFERIARVSGHKGELPEELAVEVQSIKGGVLEKVAPMFVRRIAKEKAEEVESPEIVANTAEVASAVETPSSTEGEKNADGSIPIHVDIPKSPEVETVEVPRETPDWGSAIGGDKLTIKPDPDDKEQASHYQKILGALGYKDNVPEEITVEVNSVDLRNGKVKIKTNKGARPFNIEDVEPMVTSVELKPREVKISKDLSVQSGQEFRLSQDILTDPDMTDFLTMIKETFFPDNEEADPIKVLEKADLVVQKIERNNGTYKFEFAAKVGDGLSKTLELDVQPELFEKYFSF